MRTDAYRRGVQRVYLELVDGQLNGRNPADGDSRPFLRGELRALDRAIAGALARVADRATQLHLEDTRDQIARTLTPPTVSSPAIGGTGLAQAYNPVRALVGVLPNPWAAGASDLAESCWPDLAVFGHRP